MVLNRDRAGCALPLSREGKDHAILPASANQFNWAHAGRKNRLEFVPIGGNGRLPACWPTSTHNSQPATLRGGQL